MEVGDHTGSGYTRIVIVGLPEATVKESRERVLTALSNSGCRFTIGWTIADLAGSERGQADHVSEAIQCPSLNRQVWG